MNDFLNPISLDEFNITINESTNQAILNEATLVRLISEGLIDFIVQPDQSFLLFYRGYDVYLIKPTKKQNLIRNHSNDLYH